MLANRSFLPLLLALSLPAAAVSQTAPPDLSDAEVAHAAVTANAIDAEAGAVAMSKAGSAEVRRFGEMMQRDHTAVNARASALAKELGVTPRDNAVSRSLVEGANQAKAKLAPLAAGDFDRAYVEREIAYHQAVLEALDKVLIPTTENERLKQLLVEVRPAIASHLAYAKQLAEKVHASK